MWGQSKDLEKIYGFYGKMCGIHMKKYGKVWNLCEKCMESMEKRYKISSPYRIHIKLVYISYEFH